MPVLPFYSDSVNITGSLLGTASFATTASYALASAGGGGAAFPFTGNASISGSLTVTGSAAIVAPLHILSGSTSLLYISSSGNTGIGTSADTGYRLSVSGSGTSGALRISPVFTSPNTTAQSVILVTGSMQQIQTASVQLAAVNIAPLMIFTTGSQTQTALKVTPTFSGSAAFSGSQQNIIADFGATSVGTQFSVNDVTSGSIYMVNDVSGLPILEATSDWTVNMYNYPTRVFQKTGSRVIITGSLSVAGATTVSTGDFAVSSGEITATNTRLNSYSIGNTTQILGGTTNTSGLGFGYWDVGSGNFVIPKGIFGTMGTSAGTIAIGIDDTNGITFNGGNGAIRVSRAGIFIANLTNTAGAETGDLVFKTKSGSIAMTEKMRITSAGATVISGSLTFAATSSAGAFNGEVVRFGSGTLTAGQLYFLSSSGTWSLANASSTGSSTGMLGIATGTSPTANGLMVRGFAYSGSYTTSTGSIVYAATGSGLMTVTSPSSSNHVVRVVGYVTTIPNTIYFNPDATWVTLA